jgi:hypothetical protein
MARVSSRLTRLSTLLLAVLVVAVAFKSEAPASAHLPAWPLTIATVYDYDAQAVPAIDGATSS